MSIVCLRFCSLTEQDMPFVCRVKLQWPKVHPQQVRRQTGQVSLVQGWLEDLPSAMFCTVNPRIAVQVHLPTLS